MLRQRWMAVLLALVATATVASAAFAEPLRQNQANLRPVQKLWMSDKQNGEVLTVVPSGTKTVYVVFDYKDAADTQIQVRVYDPKGQIIFSETKKYSGAGRENLELQSSDPLIDGAYITNVFIGLQGQMFLSETNEWNVGKAPAPQAPPSGQQAAVPNPAAGAPPADPKAAAGAPAPLGQAQPPVANADTGFSIPTLFGAGLLIVGLLALVIWAVRGFMAAPRVS